MYKNVLNTFILQFTVIQRLFQIPKGFSVNEEVELGVIIGKKAKHVTKEEAMEYIGGYCVALDMTATCRMVRA